MTEAVVLWEKFFDLIVQDDFLVRLQDLRDEFGNRLDEVCAVDVLEFLAAVDAVLAGNGKRAISDAQATLRFAENQAGSQSDTARYYLAEAAIHVQDYRLAGELLESLSGCMLDPGLEDHRSHLDELYAVFLIETKGICDDSISATDRVFRWFRSADDFDFITPPALLARTLLSHMPQSFPLIKKMVTILNLEEWFDWDTAHNLSNVVSYDLKRSPAGPSP